MLVDLIDKLIDRIIDLANYRQKSRKSLLNDYITPIYSEFKLVHKEYLNDFKKYRDLIKSSKYSLDENSPILDIIKKDRMFNINKNMELYYMVHAEYKSKAISRNYYKSKVKFFMYSFKLFLLKWNLLPNSIKKNWSTTETTNELVHYFLESIFFYLSESELRIIQKFGQYIRSNLITKLQIIFMLTTEADFCERGWESSLFKNCSFDNQQPEKIIERLCHKFSIEVSDPMKIEKLKIALAIHTIDDTVGHMQNNFQEVTMVYYELKQRLSGTHP